MDDTQSQKLNESNSNKIKYSKIDTNEDTYLDLKEIKTENSYLELNNENEEDLNYEKNKKRNSRKKGILNRKPSVYIYRKLGNTFTFFGDKEGSPLIVIGPHWPMYFCLCSFASLGFFTFFYNFWNYMNIIFKLFGIISYSTFFISYSYTFLINPGIPKYDKNAILGLPREKYFFCRHCCIWTNKEEKTCHCFDCNICYEGYDHHCPWTGKCIAKKTLNAFYIFIFSILCAFIYLVTAVTNAQNNIFINNKKIKKY